VVVALTGLTDLKVECSLVAEIVFVKLCFMVQSVTVIWLTTEADNWSSIQCAVTLTVCHI